MSKSLRARRLAIVLAGLAACVLALWAGFAPRHVQAAPPADPPPMFVQQGERIQVPPGSPIRERLRVAPVGSQAGAQTLAAPAVVEADPAHVVAVLPPLAGQLLELRVGLGQRVRRGELLALIAAPDLEQARADALKAADALALVQAALARAQGVLAAGGNADKDAEAAKSAVVQAVAEDRRARSRLQALTGNGSKGGGEGGGNSDGNSDGKGGAGGTPEARALRVTAPTAGVVTGLNVAAGAWINDPTQPLLAISDLAGVWVTAQVPEDRIGGLAPGEPVEVQLAAYPGLRLQGRIGLISPLVEPDTHRVKVRIAFANADGRLKPNMFATAVFALPQAAGVTVPSSALLMNNDSTTVLVEVAPWTFVHRAVEIGSEMGETVRIDAGLKPGERVVTRGAVLLND